MLSEANAKEVLWKFKIAPKQIVSFEVKFACTLFTFTTTDFEDVLQPPTDAETV